MLIARWNGIFSIKTIRWGRLENTSGTPVATGVINLRSNVSPPLPVEEEDFFDEHSDPVDPLTITSVGKLPAGWSVSPKGIFSFVVPDYGRRFSVRFRATEANRFALSNLFWITGAAPRYDL